MDCGNIYNNNHFIAVLIFCWNALQNKSAPKICIGLIVVICSLMPGLRDISVGTDSLMYANFLVVDRSYHDWLVSGIAIEPGFVFLIKLYQFIGFTNYAYFFSVLP